MEETMLEEFAIDVPVPLHLLVMALIATAVMFLLFAMAKAEPWIPTLLSAPNVSVTTHGVETDAPLVPTTAMPTVLPMETAMDAHVTMVGLLFLTVWHVILLLLVPSVTIADPSSKMATATNVNVTSLIDGEATSARLVSGTATETELLILLVLGASVMPGTLLPLTAVSAILLTLLLSVMDTEPLFKMASVTNVPVTISGLPTLAGAVPLFALMEVPSLLELARDATARTSGTLAPTVRLAYSMECAPMEDNLMLDALAVCALDTLTPVTTVPLV